MPFLPDGFEVPATAGSGRFRLRMLTIHDAFRDYEAVMESREHLWARFGPGWGWPRADHGLEQNIVDLGWHQKEFQRRSSFAYTVVDPEDTRTLGCAYIDPPAAPGAEAEVWCWARSGEFGSGLEADLLAFLEGWLARAWPFREVRLNGRLLRLG